MRGRTAKVDEVAILEGEYGFPLFRIVEKRRGLDRERGLVFIPASQDVQEDAHIPLREAEADEQE